MEKTIKRQKFIITFLVFCTGMMLLYSYLNRAPQFPRHIPSPETISISGNSSSLQRAFFDDFTKVIRKKHGGVLVAKEVDQVLSIDGKSGNSILIFYLYLKDLPLNHFLTMANNFAKEKGLLYKLKSGGYFEGQEKPEPGQYEILFMKENREWVIVRTEFESGTELSLSTIKKELVKPAQALSKEIPEEDLLPPVAAKTPRLILIIDDLGNNMAMAEKFLNLEEGLTFAIMPKLPFSRRIAEMAHAKNLDILLHMPMQPQKWPEINPGPGTLLVEEPLGNVSSVIDSALETVPYAIGVNNHMGSAYTSYGEGMLEVMNYLKKKSLFFLDSKTVSGNLAKNTAITMDVPYFSRDIFLDNKQEEQYIRIQLYKAAKLAEKYGTVITIGHPFKTTYDVLKKNLPLLREKGIQITPVTHLFSQQTL